MTESWREQRCMQINCGLLLAGFLFDTLLIAEASLCLTPRTFDVEQLRLAMLSHPFMHGAMVAALFHEAIVARGVRRIIHPLTHLTAMWLAMEISARVAPGASVIGFLAMVAAMLTAQWLAPFLHACLRSNGEKKPIIA